MLEANNVMKYNSNVTEGWGRHKITLSAATSSAAVPPVPPLPSFKRCNNCEMR
jgi:hypothetical protein